MDAINTPELLATCRRLGIPFRESVLFALKACGHDGLEIMEEIGRSRMTIHSALDGKFGAKPKMREAFRKRIGIDPWVWLAEQERQEIDQAGREVGCFQRLSAGGISR